VSLFIPNAWAAGSAAAPHGQSPWSLLIFFVVILAFFYFLAIRPQVKRQKEHKKLVDALSVGDEVITQGGVLGRVLRLTDQLTVLDIGKGVELTVQRNAVVAVLPKGNLNF
jgi:preprotein translocase subunit YajC